MKKCTNNPNPTFEEIVETLKEMFRERMEINIAKKLEFSTERDKFRALAQVVRDMMIEKWMKTQTHYYDTNPKRVYYLSLEFLMGRTLSNALSNLDITKACAQALEEMGLNLAELEQFEEDAGLGNGGLGRLAACFLDSMATLELPAYGYGIHYEFGMFKQGIDNLKQLEQTDNWTRYGDPWATYRFEDEQVVNYHGRVEHYTDNKGNCHKEWVDGDKVLAVPYDVPIPGYKNNTVNTLRLWSAKATENFDLNTFNAGDYIGAVTKKTQTENISKVLYPNDNNYEGKELRLKQQYFMVAASIQDIIRRFKNCGDDIRNFHEKVSIQLNDTHPSVAIPELMRILMDEENFSWDEAWDITIKTFAYTNHTVLPEALETWPVNMFSSLLPRHMTIINEINQWFLDDVAAFFPGDFERRANMSIIGGEGDHKVIRMAHLAIVGSHSVNGVAALHTELLKTTIFKDFYQIYREKFNNKTNGITPRRWLKQCNPELSNLINSKIGEDWTKDLRKIKELEKFSKDKALLKNWMEVKRTKKEELAKIIEEKCSIKVNLDSIFDIQVKRIHEYKRQLLNIMHVITLYNRIKKNPDADFVPRTVIFGGKAAPGYYAAKQIINLICSVGKLVNRDRQIGDKLKVVFIPNYGVSLAEKIMPGADLSEQISTAGMEASGTGNMKFALNGALTIGTLDGANIEIKEEVGDENIFICGHTESQLRDLGNSGYNPWDFYHNDEELKQVMDQINQGFFSPDDPECFKPIFDTLLNHGDRFFVLADYRSYVDCQDQVSALFARPMEWHEKAVLNVARMAKFSSDRVIGQYAEEIWDVKPCPTKI